MKRKQILAAIRAARSNAQKRTSADAYAQLERTRKMLTAGSSGNG
jgi:hypothetical protein